jgi:cell wall-associated NlpC family hydrolase
MENMYNRQQAVQYAERYWNHRNPHFRYFGEDNCTNFVSQVLLAGGIPMEFADSPNKGWWYRRKGGGKDEWSYSWAVAHSLYQYLRQKRSHGLRAVVYERPQQLQWGDLICYDWEGDGRWNHFTVVTYVGEQGQVLVHANSINSRYRDWSYQDSPAYTVNTRYTFFHILS